MNVFKLKNITFLVCVLMLCGLATSGFSEEKSWTYGGVEYRLPKPMAEIQIPAGIPEYHTVVSGDCLWFISQKYLNDPFLWPLIWEENLDTIENPHLIFPGQKVLLPHGTVVQPGENTVSEISGEIPGESGMNMEEEEASAGETTGEVESKQVARKPKPHPITSETYVISSGFISKEDVGGPTIIGSDTESFDLSMHDIIYVDKGTDAGLKPDEEYFILRKLYKVYHPISGKYLGWMIHIMGSARLLCVDEDSASLVIRSAYHPILRGDYITPKEDIPIPVTLGSPATDICNPSTRKLPGTIIDAYDGGPQYSDAVALGKGQIAYIDLGSKDGVAPGDYFTIFRHDEEADPRLPRLVVGEAMVVRVFENMSTVVMTQTSTAVFIGDQIELKQ